MEGTVNQYDRHVIISVSDCTWPKKIETDEHSLSARLACAISSCEVDNFSVKTTLCHDPFKDTDLSGKLDALRVFVYPDNISFSLNAENFSAFASLVNSPGVLMSLPSTNNFLRLPMPWKKLILVCIHGNRDRRCGRAGPPLINRLRELLLQDGIPDNEIAVRGTSHIGGHRYAGTLIVYPEAVWYGKVTQEEASELLQNIRRNNIWKKHLRGQNGFGEGFSRRRATTFFSPVGYQRRNYHGLSLLLRSLSPTLAKWFKRLR